MERWRGGEEEREIGGGYGEYGRGEGETLCVARVW